jgi:hypothetical protein
MFDSFLFLIYLSTLLVGFVLAHANHNDSYAFSMSGFSTSFSIFCKTGLTVMNLLIFGLFGRSFISPSFLKHSLSRPSNLDW